MVTGTVFDASSFGLPFFQFETVIRYEVKKVNLVNRNDSTPCSWFSDMEGERFTRRANRNTTPTKGNKIRIHVQIVNFRYRHMFTDENVLLLSVVNKTVVFCKSKSSLFDEIRALINFCSHTRLTVIHAVNL